MAEPTCPTVSYSPWAWRISRDIISSRRISRGGKKLGARSMPQRRRPEAPEYGRGESCKQSCVTPRALRSCPDPCSFIRTFRGNIHVAVHFDCVSRRLEAAPWERKKFDSVSQSDSRMIRRTEYSRARHKTSRRASGKWGLPPPLLLLLPPPPSSSSLSTNCARARIAPALPLRYPCCLLGSFAHPPM